MQSIQVSGFRFQVSGFRFQVSGFRFQEDKLDDNYLFTLSAHHSQPFTQWGHNEITLCPLELAPLTTQVSGLTKKNTQLSTLDSRLSNYESLLHKEIHRHRRAIAYDKSANDSGGEALGEDGAAIAANQCTCD